MTTDEPIYRHTCTQCARPALTLDGQGAPACREHTDALRKAPDRPHEFRDPDDQPS